MGLFTSKSKPVKHLPTDTRQARRVYVPQPIFNPIVPDPSFYKNQVQVNTPSAKSETTARKRDGIPKDIRNKVWLTYHGDKDIGTCYCCGTKIQRYNAGWHCSHVVSHDKGGATAVHNLRTCCRHCNLSMGNCNLYVYIQQKKLTGPGSHNVTQYLNRNQSQIGDKRTNNWGR